jgi:cyclopropane fatty-acyl-phospholipid synthase-like methyltransferase
MILLNQRDKSTRDSWASALEKHQLLYPDERVVSFFARNFSKRLDNVNKHAIDIGFGSGRHIKLMLDYGFQTWGVDYTDEAVNLVNAYFKEEKQLRAVVLGDFRKYPFPIKFDALVAWGVLFLNPPSEMLENLKIMKSLMAPKGKIFLNFRTKENFHYGLGEEIESNCYMLDERAGVYAGMCYTFMDLKDIQRLADSANLRINHMEKTSLIKKNMTELHTWVQVELQAIDNA